MTNEGLAQWKSLAQAVAQCGEWRACDAIRNDDVQLPAKVSAHRQGPDGRWHDTPIATCPWLPHRRQSDDIAAYLAHSSPDRVLALLEEVERLRAATMWQPIETAPKDGTRILAANDSGDVDAVHWVDNVWWTGWVTYHHRSDINEFAAVRWIPMPEAPKEQP
jgi:hypothetical protein